MPLENIDHISSIPTPISAVNTASVAANVSGSVWIAKDTLSAPPALTDSLLLKWHLAFVHLYDTLYVHPELQTMSDLQSLLNGPNCREWWATPGASDTAKQRASLVSFQGEKILAGITRTSSLVGAIRMGGLTPAEWVSTTSAIEQEDCASMNLYLDKAGHWPVDSGSALGKNLSYFWEGNKKGQRHMARLVRIRGFGIEVLTRLQRTPANEELDKKWGTRMEDWPDIKGHLIDATGQEIPIP